MKVLFILENYFPHIGGVETFFQHLAEGLAKKNFHVMVITSSYQNESCHEICNGVEIRRIPLPKLFRRYWFTFTAFFYLIFFVSRYDFIQTTTYNAALPAWLAAKLFRKKIIITVHEVWGKLWYSLSGMGVVGAFFHEFFEKIILFLPFSAYIAVSDYTYNALADKIKYREKIIRIYHGIDNDFFNPVKYSKDTIRDRYNLQRNFVCLYFGRPGWAKGVDYLIKAFVFVSRKIKNAKLILLLSEEPRSRYQEIVRLISKLDLDQSVKIISSVARKELPEFIASANCVIIPSLSEGFGFSAAEASAMEVPLVVTNVGSLPEVVSGKVVFCPGRDSNKLAQGIIDMHEGKYQVIPKKKFLWSDSVEQYVSLYSSLFK